MRYSEETAAIVVKTVDGLMREASSDSYKAEAVWYAMAHLRARYLTNLLRPLTRGQVCGGPFKGMRIPDGWKVNVTLPLCLGCYEHELHATIERVIATSYDRILNIGCAAGYYAVGLALRMPSVRVDAFDIAADARQQCAALALTNGVEDRIALGGEFTPDGFDRYRQLRTLLLMDIEGAEATMLDPEASPALRGMDMIVELHEVVGVDRLREVCQRFATSHDVTIIPNVNAVPAIESYLPDGAPAFDCFDSVLLGWEARDYQTPWGIFTAKTHAAS